MGLLSSPQCRPERVRSLAGLLVAHLGDDLTSVAVQDWLSPWRKGDSDTAVDNTIQGARDLGLLDPDAPRGIIRLRTRDLPLEPDEFADWVHAQLVRAALDGRASNVDAVLLQVYSWFVVECEKRAGTGWIVNSDRKELATSILETLRDSETADAPFNDTKFGPWKEWMVFVGLGWDADVLGKKGGFYPSATSRLEREIYAIGGQLGLDIAVPATQVLAALSQRMPYIDGGTLYREACRRAKWKPRESLTVVLSAALRDLHEDGAIELDAPGDATGALALAPEKQSSLSHVKTIRIQGRRAQES